MYRNKRSRRAWVVLVSVVVAVALVAATWIVASRFQSPAQRQANAAPPEPGPVLVAVERGDLVETATINVSGKASGGRSVDLPLREGSSVVTRPGIEPHGALSAGQVVLWANSRPVIALRGTFPLYRDLSVGDHGDDVAMLQQALAELGYAITPDGKFGDYTGKCLRDLYDSIGADVMVRQVPQLIEGTVGAQSGDSSPTAAAPKTKEQVVFPMAEALVLPSYPVTIESLPTVGATLTTDNAKVTISGDGVALVGSVPTSMVGRLSTATTGQATMGDLTIPVRVESIVDSSESVKKEDSGNKKGGGSETKGAKIALVPTDGKVPAEWAGSDAISVTINLSAPLIDVLQVPQRAIAADTGGTNVLVQGNDGAFLQVKVIERACISGMCALEESDSIKAGVKVRVDR